MGLWQLILMHREKHFSFLFVLGCLLLPEAGQAPWMLISRYFQEPGNKPLCVG